jgi:hypothetical protein
MLLRSGNTQVQDAHAFWPGDVTRLAPVSGAHVCCSAHLALNVLATTCRMSVTASMPLHSLPAAARRCSTQVECSSDGDFDNSGEAGPSHSDILGSIVAMVTGHHDTCWLCSADLRPGVVLLTLSCTTDKGGAARPEAGHAAHLRVS